MAKDTSKFTIKEKELAKALEISVERLDEIIAFFESDPDDEWELRENDHYIYVNKALKERIFAEHGAFAIAKYMDSIEKRSIWASIIEFLTRHKQKLRNAFVRRKIHENSSSLTYRNGRNFLSKKDTVNILCTSYARLNQAFDAVKRTDSSFEISKDFDEFDGVKYYSLRGFFLLSQELSKSLTVKDRREWCKAVEVVGDPTFLLILAAKTAREKEIGKAKTAAKKRDKKTCQITLQKSNKHNKFDVAAHHIYSDNDYPDLATCVDNLITLHEDIHKEFHAWNGGNQVSCTADNLIDFLMERYPDAENALLRLYTVKNMFGQQVDNATASPQKVTPSATFEQLNVFDSGA